MQINRNENKKFLGQKRNEDQIEIDDDNLNKKNEIPKEKSDKKLSLKKPELNDFINIGKNDLGLDEEKKENEDMNSINNQNSTNLIQSNINFTKNHICEKCGLENNVQILNSFKSILDYFTKNNIKLLFKNEEIFEKYANLSYDKCRMICSHCLLKLSTNQIDFENFISMNKINHDDNNESPFDNLLDNSYLKNFNNIDKVSNDKNNKNHLSSIKDKNKEILDKINLIEAQIINSDQNNTLSNDKIFNNINIIPSRNLNMGNINLLNTKNIPYINSNFNPNNNNVNIPNYYNSINNINNSINNSFPQNSRRNTELKDNINQNIPIQYYILNYPDFLQISHLNQPVGILPINYNNMPNINNMSILNNNTSLENKEYVNSKLNEKKRKKKNISNENIQSNINNSSNIINNNIQNNDNNEESGNITIIPNKDFDEIFQLTSKLYNKLLNIKIKRDLNLDLSGLGSIPYNLNFPWNLKNQININNNQPNNESNYTLNSKNDNKNNFINELYLQNLNPYNNSTSNFNHINHLINNSDINRINNKNKNGINDVYNQNKN